MQDDDLGNALHAVVFSGQDQITVEELTGFLKDGLASFKVPASFSFVDYHLRGEDGKVRRSEVAAMVNARSFGGRGIPDKTAQVDKRQQACLARKE